VVKLSKSIDGAYLTDEAGLLGHLVSEAGLSNEDRQTISAEAAALIEKLRAARSRLSPIDALLQEYGLSNSEGIILMRLAEALIRTPDAFTRNLLLRDRLIEGHWAGHVSSNNPIGVNAASVGLTIAKGWTKISGGVAARNLIARLGDRVMQQVVSKVISMMAGHFVLGSDIKSACKRAEAREGENFAFSYDMLGEAAHTAEDAENYFAQYLAAAEFLASRRAGYARKNAPSISVKLSALHPRYEFAKREHCIPLLVAKLKQLCLIASDAGFGLTIDAEEADRLELSLLIFKELLAMPELENWTGLGIVVQAYQRRAMPVIDHVAAMTRDAKRRINVRLVKGAYWDSEIKRAQEMGLDSYPVFTRKDNTDVSYLACARKLLAQSDVIFPAFATHNAHTAMAIQHMVQGQDLAFEFQRLHGMGEELHTALARDFGGVSRIYAPVGRHKELLPYLVRRLLENGANSSFVNQMGDNAVDAHDMARDPITVAQNNKFAPSDKIPEPCGYLGPERNAAAGADWTQAKRFGELANIIKAPVTVKAYINIGGKDCGDVGQDRFAPYDQNVVVGHCAEGSTSDIDTAIARARTSMWQRVSIAKRAAALRKAADLIEQDSKAFINLCVHEAGKTVPDAISEIREAVDFCRYYADEAESPKNASRKPLGIVACISPWNFPLAIFVGQVAAALVIGNKVVAKPAQQTPLIAYRAVKILHEAGIDPDALHLIIGDGALLGSHLTRQADISGICFTGSTRTAKLIAVSLADTDRALVPLIAETGGINVMIIDSTALLEQAVGDVVASAFQSAGQRCSACRIVCVQEDIADAFEEMLAGAMAQLVAGPPTNQANDVGPVIDQAAYAKIAAYIEKMRVSSREIGAHDESFTNSNFIPPTAFSVPSVSTVAEEIFGPVLHVVRFAGDKIAELIDEINAMGFGLTMGLHSRIDSRVEKITAQAKVGNIYVNRNQIGAVVGVQPFGGEGLSGTGPKAGGPHYLARLSLPGDSAIEEGLGQPQKTMELPGPTGEQNTLSLHPRGRILCLGGDQAADLERQIAKAKYAGNEAMMADMGDKINDLVLPPNVDAVASDHANRVQIAEQLAKRDGAIIPLLSGHDPLHRYCNERTVTIDLTAAGGNAELLSAS